MMSIRDKRQKDGVLRDVVLELDVLTSKDTVRMREHYGYSCAGGRKKTGWGASCMEEWNVHSK